MSIMKNLDAGINSEDIGSEMVSPKFSDGKTNVLRNQQLRDSKITNKSKQNQKKKSERVLSSDTQQRTNKITKKRNS